METNRICLTEGAEQAEYRRLTEGAEQMEDVEKIEKHAVVGKPIKSARIVGVSVSVIHTPPERRSHSARTSFTLLPNVVSAGGTRYVFLKPSVHTRSMKAVTTDQ